LLQQLGADIIRFEYLREPADKSISFDLNHLNVASDDNPLYVVYHAYEILQTIFEQIKLRKLKWDKKKGLAGLHHLTYDHERTLLTDLVRYPEQLQLAQETHSPTYLVNHLTDIAKDMVAYYHAHQLIDIEDKVRHARLTLIACIKQNMENIAELLHLDLKTKPFK
ncbi:MAG: DALR anticodon-binding domain-containing protein, partial [Pseudomonadota bacterium]